MVSAAFGATAAQAKPRDGDPFRVGDYVVYPTHGVGKIDKIGSEEIGGHRLELITISFDENKMTLRVPVAQARVTGLRKLATPEVMAQVMTILAGRPRVSRLMWAKRAQEFQAKINSGDPEGGCGGVSRSAECGERISAELQPAEPVRIGD